MEQISQVPGPTGVGGDMDTQSNHKKNIKLWTGVIVGVIVVALGATFLFKGTTIFKGQTPPTLPVECSSLTTERTCKEQSDCRWNKTGGVCTSNVVATDAGKTAEEEVVAEEKTDDGAGAPPGGEAAIFPGATGEEKTGSGVVVDDGIGTAAAEVGEKTEEEIADEIVEVALKVDDEFETACNNLGSDGVWNESASTCTYKGITFESLTEFTAATQPDIEDKTGEKDTLGGDEIVVGTNPVADEKTCMADPAQKWNVETKTCEKITAEDLPDQTSQQIQDLQNQIAQLQRELAATQSNSANYGALIQQISALQQQIASNGGQQPTIVVNVPPTSGGGSSSLPATRSVAPTECADPSFTFDAARGVCVPPAEVVVNVDESSDEDDGVNRNRRSGSGEYDPGFEVTSASAEDDSTDNQDESSDASVATTAAATGAGAAERTYGTYIQGDTGPGLLLYPVLIGAANGLFYLGRRKKRGQ